MKKWGAVKQRDENNIHIDWYRYGPKEKRYWDAKMSGDASGFTDANETAGQLEEHRSGMPAFSHTTRERPPPLCKHVHVPRANTGVHVSIAGPNLIPRPTRAMGAPEQIKTRSGLPQRWYVQASWHRAS
jgi:hypothetical protein